MTKTLTLNLRRMVSIIRTWWSMQNHFIVGLCSTNPAFPLHLWDELFEQATITINLLRQSRLHPHLSTYAHTFQPFNYTQTPLAPPGIKVIVHEAATEQGTFDPHTIPGWYLGSVMNHYRCY